MLVRRVAVLLIAVLLAVFLPLAGAYMAGHPLEPYLQFPAEPRPTRSSFEWPAFLAYVLIILVVVGPFVHRIATVPAETSDADVLKRRFPWWGWAGFALTVIGWVLAWSRVPQLEPFQRFTFTPLWLGYVLVVNGLAFRRTGRCLLLDRTACFVLLFPASAAFWWYFEYLNRFIGNWYYAGLGLISPSEYFVHASVSFSTVLPAVVSTREWLASFPRLQRGLRHLWPVRAADSRALGWLLLGLGALGFLALGAQPRYVYFMAWIAPVLVLLSLQSLVRLPGPLAGLARGDWRGLGLPAAAALFAGLFWEMWNWQSLAHWEYAVPLVHGFQLFEMPVVGYAGYLPFGVACVAISALICGAREDGHGS